MLQLLRLLLLTVLAVIVLDKLTTVLMAVILLVLRDVAAGVWIRERCNLNLHMFSTSMVEDTWLLLLAGNTTALLAEVSVKRIIIQIKKKEHK